MDVDNAQDANVPLGNDQEEVSAHLNLANNTHQQIDEKVEEMNLNLNDMLEVHGDVLSDKNKKKC